VNATAALLAAIIIYGIRDGLLAWWLVHKLVGDGAPVPAAGPVADTKPSGPDAARPGQPAATPRFTGITATSFGGAGDANSSAYGGMVSPGAPGVALPFHFSGARPKVRVFCNGKSVDCAIVDVGPWNINDPYWQSGARPQAETGTDTTGRRTNKAGIDLTPAAWSALDVSDPDAAKQKVDWDFVDLSTGSGLDGSASPAPAAGTPPWLTPLRKLRDIGVHAEHDSPIILSWPAAIAQKFPEMDARQYQHDSTPWCGLTVAYVMAMSGIKPVFGAADTDCFLSADAWRKFGTPVDPSTGSGPQPGDILVFKWSGGGEHVTLYDHEVDDDYYHCTGGNQGAGHVVSTEAMPMANCIAIRRPTLGRPHEPLLDHLAVRAAAVLVRGRRGLCARQQEDHALPLRLEPVEGVAAVPVLCGLPRRIPGLPFLVGRDRAVRAGGAVTWSLRSVAFRRPVLLWRIHMQETWAFWDGYTDEANACLSWDWRASRRQAASTGRRSTPISAASSRRSEA
jgi:hypothetical protein